jgi:shikimate dehydrogenase
MASVTPVSGPPGGPADAHRAAVLGHPIAHSLSPVLHQAAYGDLGLDRQGWSYTSIDVTEAALADFMGSLDGEWAGLSLTMPLKEAVLPLLDEVDPDAASVRAVNTVVFEGGQRTGYNTDISGLVGILNDAGVRGGSAAVVGAGATARSAVAALTSVGVSALRILARRPEAAHELVNLAVTRGAEATWHGWPETAQASHAGQVLSSDVVVSTVPAVAGASLGPPTHPGLLVDVLYDPWPTPLARTWGELGGTVVGGLELLVRQAVEQVVLMTGRSPDIDVMRRAGQVALDARAGASDIAQADE